MSILRTSTSKPVTGDVGWSQAKVRSDKFERSFDFWLQSEPTVVAEGTRPESIRALN